MPPSSTDTWDWDSQPDTCMYEKPRATFRHDTFLAPMFTCKANKPESYLAPNKSTGPATRRSMAPAIHHQRSKEQAREKKKRENHKKVKVGRIIGFLKRRGTTAHNNTERTRGGRRSRLQARKRPLELLTLLPADTTSQRLYGMRNIQSCMQTDYTKFTARIHTKAHHINPRQYAQKKTRRPPHNLQPAGRVPNAHQHHEQIMTLRFFFQKVRQPH